MVKYINERLLLMKFCKKKIIYFFFYLPVRAASTTFSPARRPVLPAPGRRAYGVVDPCPGIEPRTRGLLRRLRTKSQLLRPFGHHGLADECIFLMIYRKVVPLLLCQHWFMTWTTVFFNFDRLLLKDKTTLPNCFGMNGHQKTLSFSNRKPIKFLFQKMFVYKSASIYL